MTLRVNPKLIDISHYEDVQDKFAGAVRAGIRAVCNKLTEGLGSTDRSAFWRIGPATAAGLGFSVYHFIRPGRTEAQAQYFLNELRALQQTAPGVKIKVMLDWETEGVTLVEVKLWLTLVHSVIDEWPWLYSYAAFMGEHFTKADIADPFWKQIKLWVAAYNNHPTWPACWDEPTFWQYTGDGKGLPPHNIDGIECEGDDGIDINSYQGTDEQFDREWA